MIGASSYLQNVRAEVAIMRRSSLVGGFAVVAIFLSACADKTDHPAAQPSNPTTYRVDLDDRGRTISMRVGDVLVVDLPTLGDAPGAPGGWLLSKYPDALEAAQPRSREGHFELTATSPGSGTIFAIGDRGCRRTSGQCPVAGDETYPGPPRPVSFVLVVQVTD
jgi:hypothetical protein